MIVAQEFCNLGRSGETALREDSSSLLVRIISQLSAFIIIC
ncbi:hypothetical protein MCQ_00342 [Candidatus Bartonella washoeensis Sb944nv]|uniref:Uncharacterized protein n=1 Tax=Candidatus Bartonella washoeensis Sb944nv TaxID=1094563 RepID=J0QFM5_9HYPH|nr:hypothetical protein MCQ_00342 [Bartonella washoeensis Sb944nv]